MSGDLEMDMPFQEKPMKELFVTFARDLAAYATIELPVDTELSAENLSRIAAEAIEKGDMVFDEDWSTAYALRVVSADDGEGTCFVEDLRLDCSPCDAGVALQLFLNGQVQGFSTVVEAAAKAKLIASPQPVACTGYLALPGAQRVQVDFECRKGASREEMDLAYLQALSQIGTVDYLPIGDAALCHE